MPVSFNRYHPKDVPCHSVSIIGIASIDVVRLLYVATLPLCLGCRPNPPDLTTCTHIDVHYRDGALDYFCPGRSTQDGILSKREKEYIRSYDTWTMTDKKLIKAFAHSIRQGIYRHQVEGYTSLEVTVVCYRGEERVTSLDMQGRTMIVDDRREFEYPLGLPDLRILDPPGVKPLKARRECAYNLGFLLFRGLMGEQGRDHLSCPDPNEWGDVIVGALRRRHVIYADQNNKRVRAYPDVVIASMFICPSIHAPTDVNAAGSQLAETNSLNQTLQTWRSDYAMNPNCRKGSPEDIVFLFESKPGWNQHGGPELFTFDNHDPKGGCVLLNDGTVKFIRTEEELKQLRWK